MFFFGDEISADVPALWVRTTAFVFGALWGSFFNVAIYRWPRGMSVVKPPSHCPHCGARVRVRDNVPIFGYLLLRGRARCCGAKLTARYAWVELLSAVLCVAVAERFFVRPEDAPLGSALLQTSLYFAFVGGLLIATFVDLEWMEIPDEVSLPGAALGLATVGLREGPGAVGAAVGAGLGFLIVQVLFVWSYELLTGRRGMGEGDAKLLMMIGAFLGWEAVLFALLAGSFQGLLVAGVAMVSGAPMIPKRPDAAPDAFPDGLGSASAAADAGREAAPEPAAATGSRAPEDRASGPAMMVFGPLLALSALEYLFWGDLVTWFMSQTFGG